MHCGELRGTTWSSVRMPTNEMSIPLDGSSCVVADLFAKRNTHTHTQNNHFKWLCYRCYFFLSTLSLSAVSHFKWFTAQSKSINAKIKWIKGMWVKLFRFVTEHECSQWFHICNVKQLFLAMIWMENCLKDQWCECAAYKYFNCSNRFPYTRSHYILILFLFPRNQITLHTL